MRMLEQEDENDNNEEVTWGSTTNQHFLKLNNRIRIIQEKLEVLKQEKEALDDLSTELELSDEDEIVMYKIGEAFLHMSQPRALKRLEKDQASVDIRVAELASQADDCDAQMKDLKIQLYSKFGKAINLDE